MAVYYSIPESRILGLNTTDNKPQRVRSINRGELLRLAVYPCDTSTASILKTADNIIILGGMSPGAILYELGLTPLSQPTGSDLKLEWYIFGKSDNDTYDEIEMFWEEIPNLAANVRSSAIDYEFFSYKTLYEIAKDDDNANFVSHKNDSTWYLGIKVQTASAEVNVPSKLIIDLKYCEGTPSEMPLEDIGV